MILFLLTGQIKTYKGKTVKCVKDIEPGKGCNLCAIFPNCKTMKCSAKDRADKTYTHFENVENGKSESIKKEEGSDN